MGRGTNEILGGDTSFTILAEKADELFGRIRKNLDGQEKWSDPDDYSSLEIPHDILIFLAMDKAGLAVLFPEPEEAQDWETRFIQFYDKYCEDYFPESKHEDDVAERREKLLKPFKQLNKRSKHFHGH